MIRSNQQTQKLLKRCWYWWLRCFWKRDKRTRHRLAGSSSTETWGCRPVLPTTAPSTSAGTERSRDTNHLSRWPQRLFVRRQTSSSYVCVPKKRETPWWQVNLSVSALLRSKILYSCTRKIAGEWANERCKVHPINCTAKGTAVPRHILLKMPLFISSKGGRAGSMLNRCTRCCSYSKIEKCNFA